MLIVQPCFPLDLLHFQPCPFTQIVLGVPLITSRSNLEFWLFLIGAGAGDEEAAQLLADFPASQDAEGVRAWNADLIRRVRLGRLDGTWGGGFPCHTTGRQPTPPHPSTPSTDA